MPILIAGYWATTYWATTYWLPNYWPDYPWPDYPLLISLSNSVEYGISLSNSGGGNI